MTLGAFRSLFFYGPEIILGGMILTVVLLDLTRVRKWEVAAVATVGMLGAGGVLLGLWGSYPSSPHILLAVPQEAVELSGPARLFEGALAHDAFGLYFRLAFVVAGLLTALFAWPYVRKWKDGHGEFYAMLLSTLLGMFLMATAQTLLMMWLAIEFTSITSFILAGMLRKDRRSAEAALKYIIYSASASGVMLFGMTYLFAATGTLDVIEVGRRLQEVDPGWFSTVVSVLTIAGFGYKVAMVPFHMWCPDVYEGAPTPAAAFFSVGPKAAGIALLARFAKGVFFPAGAGLEGTMTDWGVMMAVLAVLTMTVGNLAALHQTNLKRLMAYSSIAQAGYLLLAVVFVTPDNLAALGFYVAIYILMNLGAFFVVQALEDAHSITTVDGCRGFGWRRPVLCALMTVFLLALTGMPPTGGFIAKLLLFGSVLDVQSTLGIVLVVIAVLWTVVSLGYYARVFGPMFLARPAEAAQALHLVQRAPAPATPRLYGGVLWALAIAVLVLGVWWGWLYELASTAGSGLLAR